MTIARTCDACKRLIVPQRFVELQLRVLRTTEGESQDPLDAVYGDYCRSCITNGAAITDLKSGLTKVKDI